MCTQTNKHIWADTYTQVIETTDSPKSNSNMMFNISSSLNAMKIKLGALTVLKKIKGLK